MKLRIRIAALAVSFTVAGLARAQSEQPPVIEVPGAAAERPVGARSPTIPAPSDALELSVGMGYTQGFGSLQGDVGMPSVARPGLGVDGSIGYRINPRFSIAAAAQFQELDAQRASRARGLTAGATAQYHFRPTQQSDPWVEVGTGYRLLWELPTDGPTQLTHGFELVRVRAGVDFRASPTAAIGPVVGADATTFLFQDAPGRPANVTNPTVSTFIFAGLQGRFDVGGQPRLAPAPPTTEELETISRR